MEAALAILRGETLLFSKVLPNSTPQSEKIFCAVRFASGIMIYFMS